MLFHDVIGQDLLKSRLLKTVHEGRVSHAWYFFGPEGSGALPLALSFARYMLCTERGEEDSCGHCAGCKKMNKYIHPDLHFVFPVNKAKGVDKDTVLCDDFLIPWREFLLKQPYGRLTQWYDTLGLDNKQGLITAEESRKLAAKLSLKSFESEYKVVIMWQPEKMNDQAGNKLLKLLEEPPDRTVFLLVGDQPDLLLNTIRSRCIQVKVPRISEEVMQKVLIHQLGLQESRAVDMARLASGNYLKAIELAGENGEWTFNFNRFRDFMRFCYSRNITGMVQISEELAGLTREKQKSLLEYGLVSIRESLALHFNQPKLVYISEEEETFTPKFAPFIHGKNVVAITRELNSAIADIERNGNSRIIFLDLALKLMTLLKS